MGHASLPVLQQNVGWLMQQVGAQPDEFNLVTQQMLQERQEYISQAIEPTFRTLSVTLKYLTLKALTGKGYAILVQMNYLRLIENNLILLR